MSLSYGRFAVDEDGDLPFHLRRPIKLGSSGIGEHRPDDCRSHNSRLVWTEILPRIRPAVIAHFCGRGIRESDERGSARIVIPGNFGGGRTGDGPANGTVANGRTNDNPTTTLRGTCVIRSLVVRLVGSESVYQYSQIRVSTDWPLTSLAAIIRR